jgi:hypothetical protein
MNSNSIFKHVFTQTMRKLSISQSFYKNIIQVFPKTNTFLFYTKKHFARNTGLMKTNKKLENDIISIKEKEIDDSNNIYKESRSELNEAVNKLYQRAKLYSMELNKMPFSEIEEYKQLYPDILSNFKSLNINDLEKLIRSLCYFEIKDEKTSEILNKILSEHDKKFECACLVVYALIKLNLQNENLFNKAIKAIKEPKDNYDFTEAPKNVIVPLIYSLSETEFFDKEINEKIDEYINKNIQNFNEYVIIKFFTIFFYFF